MDHAQRTPEQALDLLLALRPDDRDNDVALLAALDPEVRAATESEDAAFAALLQEWTDEPLPEPTFTAADIFALAEAADGRGERASGLFPLLTANKAEVERPDPDARDAGRATTGSPRPWLAPVALAAGLAVSVVGLWAIQPTVDPETRNKALVSDVSSTRIGLQVSVESSATDRVLVTPGRQGAAYGPNDALAFRFALEGQAGWVTLLEVTPAGDWSVVHPSDGPLYLSAGVHSIADGAGAALVYRPDEPSAGTLTYVAIVTSEAVEPTLVVPGLLSAGFERADLWPRPVVAADAFTVTWSSP